LRGFLQKRIERLQERLSQWSIDALLIEQPIDLFYLTGLRLSKGRLIVSLQEVNLWVDGRYFAYACTRAPCKVALWEKNAPLPSGRVGFDSATTSVETWERLREEASSTEWQPISKPLKEMRIIKEEREIAALEKAAAVSWKGIERMKRLLRVGVSELEIAWEFEQCVRMSGASGLSFEPIVAFGKNSALPHHRASSTCLLQNQIVLLDVGAIVDGYSGDVTRVYFFGEPDRELYRMYGWVREAHLAARRFARPGERVQALDLAARDVFAREGVEKLFVHSLGHGIGLETHESPLLRKDGADAHLPLQKGMVFTIEPGLYLPDVGGVRLEDTGYLDKTQFISFYPELEVDPLIR